jgi:predicted  nucleic acid-binding Zn-ribbon protein
MKQCTTCGRIYLDGDTPYIFCLNCGGHAFEVVGDELPFWANVKDMASAPPKNSKD